MPPSRHAILSASSAFRWLNCSPSARLEREFAERETEAAAEGSAAHALAEYKLRRALKQRSKRPISPFDSEEMEFQRAISTSSGLPFTGIINNTHLLRETALADVLKGYAVSMEVSAALNIPIVYNCCPPWIYDECVKCGSLKNGEIFRINMVMRLNYM